MSRRVLLSCAASGSLRLRARAFGTSLSGFGPPLTAPRCSRVPQSHVARSLKNNTRENRKGEHWVTQSVSCAPHHRRDRSQKVARTPLTSTASKRAPQKSPSKDLAPHTHALLMATTLNQQAMEHAMASRPAITDPVALSARAGFQFARFAAMAWRSAPCRESAHCGRASSDALDDAGLPEQGPRRPQDHLRLAAARQRRRAREHGEPGQAQVAGRPARHARL